jgi:transposase
MERGCGIDVHKSLLAATICGTRIKEETREYGTFTEDIEDLRDWLKEQEITHIDMESTGVYWIFVLFVFNILGKEFEIILVNARHIRTCRDIKQTGKTAVGLPRYC